MKSFCIGLVLGVSLMALPALSDVVFDNQGHEVGFLDGDLLIPSHKYRDRLQREAVEKYERLHPC